jgi:hypothetical protein
MKFDFKNGKMINSVCCVVFIVLSYLFNFWYSISYVLHPNKLLNAVLFIVLYCIFVLAVAMFIKASNSIITLIIVALLSVQWIKGAITTGPLQLGLYNINDSSVPIYNYIIQVIILILNLAVLVYVLYKLHQELENIKSHIN